MTPARPRYHDVGSGHAPSGSFTLRTPWDIYFLLILLFSLYPILYLYVPQPYHSVIVSITHSVDSIIISMTWQWHCVSNTIASMVPQRCHQYDSEGLAHTFPPSNLTQNDHHWLGPGAWAVPLQPIARLKYTFNYIIDLDLRRACRHHHVMGHFAKQAKSFS
jgi:hypothetical protein